MLDIDAEQAGYDGEGAVHHLMGPGIIVVHGVVERIPPRSAEVVDCLVGVKLQMQHAVILGNQASRTGWDERHIVIVVSPGR
jgi:hypothetical protein